MTQNSFATLALLSWPLVVLWLYKTRSISEATIWAFLGAYMLLPVNSSIKIEGIPDFNKMSIPALAALVFSRAVAGQRLKWFKRFGFTEFLIILFILVPFVTAQLNTDPVILPNRTIPGSTVYEGISAVTAQFIAVIPFLLGRQLLATSRAVESILVALATAGLLYSLPMLVEIRLSPQLHYWIYGFFPTQFNQAYRYGGFRPVVFMGHGLLVAFFAATAVMASAALWRTKKRLLNLPLFGVTVYLSIMVVLCKTLGAFLYGVVFAPLIRWGRPQLQLAVAVILVVLALLYPLLRTQDLVPTDTIVAAVTSVNPERAGSLQLRFESEEKLLARASERIWFGWGRFGRNRIYSEDSGQDMVFTDGRWIIVLGSFGLFGFIAEFGLLAISIFRASSALRFTESFRDSVYLAALALIVATNVIDLIPNSTISPWTWLLAGALMGRAEMLRQSVIRPKPSSRNGNKLYRELQTQSTHPIA